MVSIQQEFGRGKEDDDADDFLMDVVSPTIKVVKSKKINPADLLKFADPKSATIQVNEEIKIQASDTRIPVIVKIDLYCSSEAQTEVQIQTREFATQTEANDKNTVVIPVQVQGRGVPIGPPVGRGVPIDFLIGRGVPMGPPVGRGVPMDPLVGRGVPMGPPVGRGVPISPPVGRSVPMGPPVGRGVPMGPPVGRGVPMGPPVGRGIPLDMVTPNIQGLPINGGNVDPIQSAQQNSTGRGLPQPPVARGPPQLSSARDQPILPNGRGQPQAPPGRGPPQARGAPSGPTAIFLGLGAHGRGPPIGRGQPFVSELSSNQPPTPKAIPVGFVPKRVLWQVLPKFKAKSSFFVSFQPDSYSSVQQIDYKLLTDMFCRTEEEIKIEEDQKKKQADNQVEACFVIEQKRINEVAMAMSAIKSSPNEIEEALNTLDEFSLDEDTIIKLLRICPAEEERKLLQENASRISQLSLQEQFIFKLMNVNNVGKVLECLLFKSTFEEQFLTMNKSLEFLKLAISSIKENKPLMEVIAVLLTVGNYLNQGTNKGNSQNFQMDFLLKLSVTKGVGKYSKSSLLEYLVTNLAANSPTQLQAAVLLESTEPSTKIDLAILATKLKDFQAGLALVQGEITATQKLNKASAQILTILNMQEETGGDCKAERLQIEQLAQKQQTFLETFEPFLKLLQAKIDHAASTLTQITTSINDLQQSFGEDPKEVKPKDFFFMFYQFGKEFAETYTNLVLKQKAASEKAKRLKQPIETSLIANEHSLRLMQFGKTSVQLAGQTSSVLAKVKKATKLIGFMTQDQKQQQKELEQQIEHQQDEEIKETLKKEMPEQVNLPPKSEKRTVSEIIKMAFEGQKDTPKQNSETRTQGPLKFSDDNSKPTEQSPVKRKSIFKQSGEKIISRSYSRSDSKAKEESKQPIQPEDELEDFTLSNVTVPQTEYSLSSISKRNLFNKKRL